jgi:hypothetical protein
MMKKMIVCYVFLIVMPSLLSVLHAAVPKLINYQGTITDASGPVNGSHDLTFKFYPDSLASAALWTEVHFAANISYGLFNVILGSVASIPDSLFSGSDRWIGVSVDSDPEIEPRARITSVPWAMRAAMADTALACSGESSDRNSLDAADGDPVDALLIDDIGRVGIGKSSPAAQLHLGQENGQYSGTGLRLEHSAEGFKDIAFNTDDIRDWVIRGYAPNQAHGCLLIWAVTGKNVWFSNTMVGIGTSNPASALHVVGRTTTSDLQITGGSDIAEPFPSIDSQSIIPGCAVVIDPENDGHIEISAKPYDRRVAGIVSGAGGINTGLTLSQEGATNKGLNVALSGRVYAMATTANGSIHPGDFLTTSSVPGRVMRVEDYEKARGAIVGKAMSSLKTGEGLVLILIGLQ